MEGVTSILVQLKTIVILATSVSNPFATTEDLGVDVRVEETKAKVMEE
jgi:hypothetical protein